MKDKSAHKWFILAILFLGLGGAMAFLVAMCRTPFGYKYFPSEYMYHALVGHVDFAILLWLMSFAVVLWRLYLGIGSKLSFTPALSLIGAILVALTIVSGRGEAVTNNYVPVIDHPVFLLGMALFFIAFTINVAAFLKFSLSTTSSRSPLKGACSTSVIIAAVMALAMVLSPLFTGNYEAPNDSTILYYERLFWTPGHIQQILNGAMLITVWHILGLIAASGKMRPDENTEKLTDRWSRALYASNYSLIVSAAVVFSIPIFLNPLSTLSRAVAESVYAIGLGVPIFVHAAYVIRGLERRLSSVAYLSLVLSMVIYLFGVSIAYSGLGDDLRVPAHYHGAVTSLTLALMGLSYYYIKGLGSGIYGERLARFQPMIYGSGMFLFILGLFVSGAFGAPRKTYGMDFTSNPMVVAALSVMGLGTLLAVSGGIIFVYYASASLLREWRKSNA